MERSGLGFGMEDERLVEGCGGRKESSGGRWEETRLEGRVVVGRATATGTSSSAGGAIWVQVRIQGTAYGCY